jgi:hypothetical protein
MSPRLADRTLARPNPSDCTEELAGPTGSLSLALHIVKFGGLLGEFGPATLAFEVNHSHL